ncbi:Protein ABHD18 [Hondaea fermentalgiana]|uniref:Protein ABHD18 n=1 Tax=Hondaea fermentalgiana TaxID=2315210 RepID=A0A2R5GL81_9STRA|nr:Protein ABHD18 [Hondaea fermentalgiana]|eukprot:GBG31630.1 Protein ABHD18 [Hondaea fermentalgiana]
MTSFLSSVVGAFDILYIRSHKHKFFEQGWGDADYEKDQTLLRIIEEDGTTNFPDIDHLEFADGTAPGDEVRICSFDSPCADWLPEETRKAYAMIVSPPEGVEIRGVLIQAAGTGEEGFSLRRKQVAEPLATEGFVSIILQNTFYGRRRANDQTAFYIATVGRFLLQLPTTLIEFAKLAKYAKLTYPGVPIGLTGTSFGGSVAMSAFPSVVDEFRALDKGTGTQTPIALCTFLPPARSESLFESVFKRIMDFQALVVDKDGYRTVEEATARLGEIFVPRELSRFFVLLGHHKPSQTAFTNVRALHDHYVRPSECQVGYETVLPFVASGRLVDVSGGHCSNILQTSKILPKAILETFEMLESLPSPVESESGSDAAEKCKEVSSPEHTRPYVSRIIGAFDLLYVYSQKHKFFAEGWGDEEYEKDQALLRIIEEDGTTTLPDIDQLVFIDETAPEDEICVCYFDSPCADWLPDECKKAYAMIVSPPKGDEIRGILIQVAGTGDEGFSLRRKEIAEPLAADGFVSIILECAFYGQRRPQDQTSFFIGTVGSYLLQLPTTIIEVSKLAKYAKVTYAGVPIGLVGTSFGGSVAIAAYPSIVDEFRVLDEGSGTETPIALCTFLPPARCEALFESAFSHLFDYQALILNKDGYRTLEDATARLREVLAPRTAALGRLAGGFDSVYVSGRRVKFFADGWGGDAMDADRELISMIQDKGTTGFADIPHISYGNPAPDGSRIGTFPSPCAAWLPKESKTAHVMCVTPPSRVPLRGVVVHLAATGDEGFAMRRDQVAKPLAKEGFASLILETPFYGHRRPVNQRAYFISSVGSFLLQMPTTLVEAAKLVKHAAQLYPGVPIGLSGTSFGGAVAAAAYPSAVIELESIDDIDVVPPLALCTFAAPSRSMALMTGVFHRICHFRTLTKDEEGFRTKREAKARLTEVLEPRELDPFFDILRCRKSPPPRAAFTCVRALHDMYVRPQESMMLFDIMQPFVISSRKIDISGGHVSSILQTSRIFPRVILETFDAVDRFEMDRNVHQEVPRPVKGSSLRRVMHVGSDASDSDLNNPHLSASAANLTAA